MTMTLQAPWLDDPAAQAVAKMLEDAGHQALFVGGCVRNTLLDAPVSDLDLATDAHPETVIKLSKAAGLKPVPTGLDHGTITVVAHDTPVEVTTFRCDVETDGRHAVVAFSDNVAEDAARRDLTMNALYADRRGLVVDPLHGMPDLQARRVRFVGHAPDRVKEDFLRILRFFRFHAWYGAADGGLDPDGLAACAAHHDGLQKISAERVGSEFRKLLSAPDPGAAVAAMSHSGVLQQVLPGSDIRALLPLIHLQGESVDWLARLAALGGEDQTQRLRLSKTEATRLERLITAATKGQPAPELGYRLGVVDARAALCLRAALFEAPVSLTGIEVGAAATFPLAARDLMPALSGPALGAALRDLESEWINSGFTLDRDALIKRSHDT